MLFYWYTLYVHLYGLQMHMITIVMQLFNNDNYDEVDDDNDDDDNSNDDVGDDYNDNNARYIGDLDVLHIVASVMHKL